MHNASTLILGAGVTGLAAGASTGGTVVERACVPGGICSSYYRDAGSSAAGRYRFELGGGHWIFGGAPETLEWMEELSPTRRYERRAAVFFPRIPLYVPYPIQNHLSYLDSSTAAQVLEELRESRDGQSTTLAQWLQQSFGATLSALFFEPFHALYTAGLHTRIAPQDPYKSPVDPQRVAEGAAGRSGAVGYNVRFRYPEQGLDHLAWRMAERCDLRLGSEVSAIDPGRRRVQLTDGTAFAYERLISTLPLHETLRLGGVSVDVPQDPHTAVLVLNIGATAGPACPDHHWLYVPQSRSGFHRVGFYSNVDPDFAPRPTTGVRRVSLYIEKAYLPGKRPTELELSAYCRDVVEELTEWGFITDAEVVDPTWVEVAYTWAWPGSTWRQRALDALKAAGIEPVGRYARWHFQGIADSVRDGLRAGERGPA